MSISGKIEIVLRWALAGIFIYASLDKIVHPEDFAEIIHNYHILPGFLINIAAIVLPWLEILLGLLLIAGRFRPGATGLAAILLAAFWAALLFNLARGLDINCGCFSTRSTEPSSMAWYVLRDTAFLAIGLFLFYKSLIDHKELNTI